VKLVPVALFDEGLQRVGFADGGDLHGLPAAGDARELSSGREEAASALRVDQAGEVVS
jgi:hypothetical protein